MRESKNKQKAKPEQLVQPISQDITAIANEAMLAAQKKAIEEDRRYGLEPVLASKKRG